MTDIEEGRTGRALAVLDAFVGSLGTSDLAEAPDAVAAALAEVLAGLVDGAAMVVFEDEGVARLAGCHPGGELARGLAASHRPLALVHLALGPGTDPLPSPPGTTASDGEREVLAVLADAGVRRLEGAELAVGGRRLGAAIWCPGVDEPSADTRGAVASLVALAAVIRSVSIAADEQRRRAEQLQHALTSRILVEQAKGMLAQQGGVPPDVAFEVLRAHCRRTNQRVQAVAADVVQRRVAWEALSPR